jgi:hypothetical protein
MGLGRAWDVPEEFWIFWRRNRELRQLILEAEVEPVGKGRAVERARAAAGWMRTTRPRNHHLGEGDVDRKATAYPRLISRRS